jgi:hypothetical protein
VVASSVTLLATPFLLDEIRRSDDKTDKTPFSASRQEFCPYCHSFLKQALAIRGCQTCGSCRHPFRSRRATCGLRTRVQRTVPTVTSVPGRCRARCFKQIEALSKRRSPQNSSDSVATVTRLPSLRYRAVPDRRQGRWRESVM